MGGLPSEPKGFTDFNDLANKSQLGKDGLKRQVTAAVMQVQKTHQQRLEQQRQQTQKRTTKQEQGMRM